LEQTARGLRVPVPAAQIQLSMNSLIIVAAFQPRKHLKVGRSEFVDLVPNCRTAQHFAGKVIELGKCYTKEHMKKEIQKLFTIRHCCLLEILDPSLPLVV
jgi:hypothetical protein